MKKLLKIFGWGALAIVLLFALILALSPVVTYVANNYGEQIVGRQLHADRIVVNPFWGGVTIRGFQCKEQNGETDFVSFDRLYVQIAWPQLAAKNVNLRHIHLDGFNGQVLKSNDRLNFTDIIERFSRPDSVPADTTKSDWKVRLSDIRINNSTVRYRDVVSNKQWSLDDLSLHVPGLYFDNQQTNAGVEFALPTGGRVGIVAGYKMQSNRYAVRLNLYDVHLDVVLPLVQDYLDVSGLGALLNGQIHVDGSLEQVNNIVLKGHVNMAGLNLRDRHNTQIAALDELRVVLHQGDVANNSYILDSLVITGLTGNYEVHENWTTLTRLLQAKENNVDSSAAAELEETTEEKPAKPANATKPLVWMAKNVILTGHDLMYHDYGMKHDWEYGIEQIRVDGKNVASNGRNALNVKATLTHNAKLTMDGLGGPNLKNQDGHLNLKLTGVQLEDFSALCRNYTGYPLEAGVLNLESHMQVKSGQLSGNNTIVIDQPKVGKRERFTKAKYKNIPVRAGFNLLTSAQNMIVLEVPVKGDVNNPKFDLRKVIGRALLKVFFGPLMGVDDKKKGISDEELEEMRELLGEDTVSDVSADVAVTASDSVGLSKVGE